MSQLAGKTVIITGSSRGVGADTAQILAAQGANIIVNYRSKAPRANKVVKAIEEAGGHATAIQADVTKSEDLTNLVNVAIETYGSLDYLILNASGGMETGMGEDYAMRLNRDAQLNLARLAAEKCPTEDASSSSPVTRHTLSAKLKPWQNTSRLQSPNEQGKMRSSPKYLRSLRKEYHLSSYQLT